MAGGLPRLPFSVINDFDYPGHSARRMHGLPSRSGTELINRLRQVVEQAAIPLVVNATVTALYADGERVVRGFEITGQMGRGTPSVAARSFLRAMATAPPPISSHSTFRKCVARIISGIPVVAAMR